MKTVRGAVLAVFAVATVVTVASASAATAERVSVAADGTQANAASEEPATSADGRYTAFVSDATNLVAGDTNGRCDIFVRDNDSGAIERVSVSSAEAEGSGGAGCERPAISGDGRYVAFSSNADGLVADDTAGNLDVFVRDRQLGTTARVSAAPDGTTATGQGTAWGAAIDPALSADGRYVAFASSAANLIAGEAGSGYVQVYVRDLSTGALEM